MKRIALVVLCLFVTVSLLSAADKKKEEPKEKSTKEYIADLSSNDEAKIIEAADYLGRKEKEESAIPQLKNLLKNDKRDKVRVYAAMALGYIGNKSALDVLKDRLINDQSADVRYTALLSISRIGLDKKEDKEVLDKAKASESDPFILDFVKKLEEKYKEK